MEMQKEDVLRKVKKGVGGFVNTINEMTGQEGNVEIRLKELVSGVLKKHSWRNEKNFSFVERKKQLRKKVKWLLTGRNLGCFQEFFCSFQLYL